MNMLAMIRTRGRAPEAQTFRARYERGTPWDGYADQEVLDRYQRAVPGLTPAEFERAAWRSLERLSTQDRLMFGEYLLRQAESYGTRLPGLADDDPISLQDSHVLAHALGHILQRQPDLLDYLLGAQSAPLDSLLTKAVLAGIAADTELATAGSSAR